MSIDLFLIWFSITNDLQVMWWHFINKRVMIAMKFKIQFESLGIFQNLTIFMSLLKFLLCFLKEFIKQIEQTFSRLESINEFFLQIKERKEFYLDWEIAYISIKWK